jgi:hypothetical protein
MVERKNFVPLPGIRRTLVRGDRTYVWVGKNLLLRKGSQLSLLCFGDRTSDLQLSCGRGVCIWHALTCWKRTVDGPSLHDMCISVGSSGFGKDRCFPELDYAIPAGAIGASLSCMACTVQLRSVDFLFFFIFLLFWHKRGNASMHDPLISYTTYRSRPFLVFLETVETGTVGRQAVHGQG